MTFDRSESRDSSRAVLSVRQVDEHDWGALREIRLAALTDSPSAFGSTLDRELAFDEQRWRSWPSMADVHLAFADTDPVGMVAVVADESSDERELVAMWVTPSWRGQGVSGRLVDAAVDGAAQRGAQFVSLFVIEDNETAVRFYNRHGFRATDRREPFPRDPSRFRRKMLREL